MIRKLRLRQKIVFLLKKNVYVTYKTSLFIINFNVNVYRKHFDDYGISRVTLTWLCQYKGNVFLGVLKTF